MIQEFIIWRDKNKKHIRTFIMFFVSMLLVWDVAHLMTYTKEISSPEFNNQKFENFQDNNVNLSEILDNNVYVGEIQKVNIIPYNPISKAIWTLLNISFDLFLIGLLWKSQE